MDKLSGQVSQFAIVVLAETLQVGEGDIRSDAVTLGDDADGDADAAVAVHGLAQGDDLRLGSGQGLPVVFDLVLMPQCSLAVVTHADNVVYTQ